MAGSKRDRQRAGRQARLAAMAAAKRRQQRKRTLIWVAVAVVAVVGVVVLTSLASDDDGEDVASGASTTVGSSVPAANSAAGKPCVAVADALPAGAPAVPVEVGPPPTQLVTKDLRQGTGPEVAKNATVTVNYIGVSCSTGAIFDSSYAAGQPATFPLSGVIKGWTDGIPGMKVGGQRLLGIPSEQAYGSAGRPPKILPDEPLWFVVEVLDAKAGCRGTANERRATLAELVRLVPSCLALLRDILRDPTVPRRTKVVPALVVAYLAFPFDLIPDFIPVIGQLDDAFVVAWAIRKLVKSAGRERVAAHWKGDPATLERLLRLARVP